jgi:hypothetical protein
VFDFGSTRTSDILVTIALHKYAVHGHCYLKYCRFGSENISFGPDSTSRRPRRRLINMADFLQCLRNEVSTDGVEIIFGESFQTM